MKKLFLLDAYALIYRAYYALIRSPRINSKGMNTSAIFGFVNTLEEVLRNEKPTHIGVAFDPKGGTFRHKLYPEYKAQREKTPEDISIAIPYIKEIIKAYNIPILEVQNYEADDVIGTLSKIAAQQGFEVYMMTPDKDYAQLVADNIYMYRPGLGQKGKEILDVAAVCKKYELENTEQVIDMLGLMGDTADNIKGCPGVGPKTAIKLIKEFGTIDNLLQNTNQLKGALKKKVEENIDIIRLSKELVTIDLSVPISFNSDDLKLAEKNSSRLREIFEELEFRLLSKRILGVEAPKVIKVIPKGPIQGDLFAEIPSEDTEIDSLALPEALTSGVKKYYLIDNQKRRADFIAKILVQKKIAFDTETTGLEPLLDELVGLSFSFVQDEAYYVPIPSDQNEAQKIVNEFKLFFESEEITKIGQNIKFDILILSKYGIKVKGELFDTMIAHYLLQPELLHNMNYLAEIYLNYTPVPIEELIGKKGKNQLSMRDVPIDKIKDYAAEDADVTYQLYLKLNKEIKDKKIEKLFYDIEMPLVRVLVNMESNGVCLDIDSLQKSSEKFKNSAKMLEQKICDLAGESFNINSPRQVGEVLFEKLQIVEKAKKTKSGQYSTSEEVLQKMITKHPIVPEILEYRGLRKLINTYIDALPGMLYPTTNKLHTSYNQATTATGRLSSSNPNLQNIPIRDEYGKEIRKAFIPEKGCLFFSADYSQIELRIMAHLSEDPNMIEAFIQGHDIHTATAAKIYKVEIDEVTKEMRTKAKTANFGIIYGISVYGLAQRLTIPNKEAKALIEGYFETYKKVQTYMLDSIQIAKEKGYVETLLHRLRYLPDINSRNSIVRGYAERNAINAPIQGSAADIIKIAMIRILKQFKRYKLRSKMILQVHDELNFSVFPEEKELVQKIVKEEMENAYSLKVPLTIDYGWGENWLQAH